jgi:hypothetical protein
VSIQVVELKLHFRREYLSAVFAKLAELPSSIRPTAVAVDEVSKREPLMSTEMLQPDELINTHRCGVVLYGEAVEFHLSYADTDACSLLGLFASDDQARDSILEMAKLDVLYGYACAPEERNRRNRIVSKKKYGSHEAWVGRDYQKYLPGVYWLNLIPASRLEGYGLSLRQFEGIAHRTDTIRGRNHVIELYPASMCWEDRSDNIDRWCEMTAGVFHRADAIVALEGAETFMETSTVLNPWK